MGTVLAQRNGSPMTLQASRGYSLIEMMIVVGLTVVLAAFAIPMSGNALGYFRLSGDAKKVSAAITLAKMRAASNFSQSRLFVDLSTKTYHMETYQKTGTPGWIWEGGSTDLSQGVSPGFGSLTAPPASTQGTIAQAPQCLNDANVAVANTACVVFNSRGIPIDPSASDAPTTADAIYVTDGSTVYGVTVLITGNIDVWRSGASTAAWTKQQ